MRKYYYYYCTIFGGPDFKKENKISEKTSPVYCSHRVCLVFIPLVFGYLMLLLSSSSSASAIATFDDSFSNRINCCPNHSLDVIKPSAWSDVSVCILVILVDERALFIQLMHTILIIEKHFKPYQHIDICREKNLKIQLTKFQPFLMCLLNRTWQNIKSIPNKSKRVKSYFFF